MSGTLDIPATLASLESLVIESSAFMETHRRLPPELVDALEEAGVFRSLLPIDRGGLDLGATDFLELIYGLARIDASVAVVAAAQSGHRPALGIDATQELRAGAGSHWIVSGSYADVGTAVKVDGGYRFTGQWTLVSGVPWATHLLASARVLDEHGEPLVDPVSGEALVIDGVFPRDEVGGWNDVDFVGLRGTGSGEFRLDDAFLDERFTARGSAPATASGLLGVGSSALFLGMARGAIDQVLVLARRKNNQNSSMGRAASLGREQMHRIELAEADALVRAARRWSWEVAERSAGAEPGQDPDERLALRAEQLQADVHAAQVARKVMRVVHNLSGSDSVIRGRGLELRLRDVYTAIQQQGSMRRALEAHGGLADAAPLVATSKP